MTKRLRHSRLAAFAATTLAFGATPALAHDAGTRSASAMAGHSNFKPGFASFFGHGGFGWGGGHGGGWFGGGWGHGNGGWNNGHNGWDHGHDGWGHSHNGWGHGHHGGWGWGHGGHPSSPG